MRLTISLLLLGLLGGCGDSSDSAQATQSAAARGAGAIHASPDQLIFSAREGGSNPKDGTVVFWHGGSEALAWTASSDQPWLTVEPSSGVAEAFQNVALSIHVDASYQIQGWKAVTSTVDAPTARWVHSAAWTGSEMVVWGGSQSTEPNDTDTGGRYDPVTNTWAPTSLAGAPTARHFHSAVWTGDRMVVWGGWNGEYFATGGLYAPDAWFGSTSVAGAASAREAHSAVWTGSEMIVWGGWANEHLATGGRYSPASDSWLGGISTTGAASPRQEHVAVWDGRRMIVWGGRDGADASTSLGSGALYDPARDQWTGPISAVGAPSARTGARAVWMGREMIVWGGHDGVTHLDTGFRYRPDTNTWLGAIPTAGAPSARYRHSAVWTGDRMIVWGGQDAAGYTDTGAVYVPPVPAVGEHEAVVTLSPVGRSGPTHTIRVSLTVTP